MHHTGSLRAPGCATETCSEKTRCTNEFQGARRDTKLTSGPPLHPRTLCCWPRASTPMRAVLRLFITNKEKGARSSRSARSPGCRLCWWTRTSLGLHAMYWIVSCLTNGLKLHRPAAKCSAVIGVCMASITVPGSLPGEELFVARPLTAEHSFTAEIEGPACDRAGNIFAVSFVRKPTIGRISPDGKGEVFVEMPEGSLANGIR